MAELWAIVSMAELWSMMISDHGIIYHYVFAYWIFLIRLSMTCLLIFKGVINGLCSSKESVWKIWDSSFDVICRYLGLAIARPKYQTDYIERLIPYFSYGFLTVTNPYFLFYFVFGTIILHVEHVIICFNCRLKFIWEIFI